MKRFCVIMCLLVFCCTMLASCTPLSAPEISFTRVEPAEESVTPEPSVEPEPTPEPPEETQPVYEPLSEGSESAAVAQLQARLNELGYARIGEPTEKYGPATKKAVELFRRQNGFSEDSAADAELQALLFSEDAPACIYPLAGFVIGLDPGHQAKGNSELEPVSPGSSKQKKKVSSGTQGRFTGVPEYKVNLAVGLLLKDRLENAGATVIMTRETDDVNISNVERAQLFNQKQTDYALRLHCNGSENASIHGAFMLIPKENPYQKDCERAAELLIQAYCESTGAKSLGITVRGDQTGFNWCERMIVNIEMGHMTNKNEDELLTSADYQDKMAEGLYQGILDYFA